MMNLNFGYQMNVFGDAGRLDLSLIIVLLTGIYLVGLAVVCAAKPAVAERFLTGFAGSAGMHYLELAVRVIAGISFVRYAPQMPFSAAFSVFGWVVLITTVVLFAVPWRWHRRFTERSVPQALQYIKLIAAVSFLAGFFVIGSAFYAVFAH